MTTIDATVARLMAQAWDIAINPDGFEAALRAALTEAQPVCYVNGDELDNMLDARTATIETNISGYRRMPLYACPIAQPAQPTRKALSDAEILTIAEKHLIDGLYKRSGVGVLPFAHAIEAAHGIGAQK